MPAIRTFAIVVLSAMAAFFSTAAATTRVFETRVPQLARRMAVADGFADSAIAQGEIAQSIKPGTLLDVDWSAGQARRIHDLAISAFRHEPFDADAVAYLALAADAQGHGDHARALMRDAEKLTRRSTVTNLWLMADYAAAGDDGHALSSLDNALRTNGAGRPLLVRALIQSLAREEMVQPVARLLQDNPPWAREFWNQSYRVAGVLPNVARLRVIAARRNLAVEDHASSSLLGELTRLRLFDDARAVFDALEPGGPAAAAGLRNSGFDRAPGFLPFDWELFFDDSTSADIIPRAGVMRVSTFNSGGGRVARQLVALAGGAYRLSAKARDWDKLDADAVYFRLACAERAGSPNTPPIPLSQPELSVRISKPAADCTYYWFEVFARPQPQQQDNQVLLDEVSLRPVTAGG